MLRKIEHKIELEEWVEAKIYEYGFLKETRLFKGNTVSSTGKNALAEVIGAIDESRFINRIWAKVSGTIHEKTSSNSRSGHTLRIATPSAYTAIGTYTGILTGNDSDGSGSWYNSIALNITLPAGSEIDFTVKWVFSGNQRGWGNTVCASAFGNIGDGYDEHINTISISDNVGPGQTQTRGCANSVSANVLTCINTIAFSGPNTCNVTESMTPAIVNNVFDGFDGFTISWGSEADIYLQHEYTFG